MKRERLHLPGGMTVETSRDWNGRFFIAYSKDASVFLRCEKELRRFLRLPLKTPSREALDSWLVSLESSALDLGADDAGDNLDHPVELHQQAGV